MNEEKPLPVAENLKKLLEKLKDADKPRPLGCPPDWMPDVGAPFGEHRSPYE